ISSVSEARSSGLREPFRVWRARRPGQVWLVRFAGRVVPSGPDWIPGWIRSASVPIVRTPLTKIRPQNRRSLGEDDAKIWVWVAGNDEAMTIGMKLPGPIRPARLRVYAWRRQKAHLPAHIPKTGAVE